MLISLRAIYLFRENRIFIVNVMNYVDSENWYYDKKTCLNVQKKKKINNGAIDVSIW